VFFREAEKHLLGTVVPAQPMDQKSHLTVKGIAEMLTFQEIK